MRFGVSTLFEMTEEEVLAHCTNEIKCLCPRSYRGQAYRGCSRMVRVFGQGNQISLKPPVLAFYRAAYYFDENVPKTAPCPALDRSIVQAFEQEENPSQDVVTRFVEVLRRVFD